MKKLFLLLALTATLIGCSQSNKKQVSIAKSELIGTWFQESTGAAVSNGEIDNQAFFYFKDLFTLNPDGSYIAETNIKFIHTNMVATEDKIHIDGKWELDSDSITTYIDRIIHENDTNIIKNEGEGNTVKIIHLTSDSIVFQRHEDEVYEKKMREGKFSLGSFRVDRGTSYGVLYRKRD